MTIKREFGRMSTYVEKVNVEEHFEELHNDDGRVFFLGKKEFHHEEEGLDFKYKYAVRIIDMEGATGEEGQPIYIELLLVPSPSSICEKAIEDVGSSFCWETEDLSEDFKYYDIAEYSLAVVMDTEALEVDVEDRYDLLDIPEVVAKIEALTALYESVDRMRGFNLDRCWNMIGTTGRDTLNHAINGEGLFKF